MTIQIPSVRAVRGRVSGDGLSVTVVVPAYGEGDGIVATLRSLREGMCLVGLDSAPMFLSDSSPDMTTADAAHQWAATVGCKLMLDHSDERRSLKAALNVALEHMSTDVIVVTVADVIVPPESFANLLATVTEPHGPDVVVGLAIADPSVTDLRYRAGSFQLSAVARRVRSGGTGMRAEGAFWAARRSFYEHWRFPIGHGSIADDVELARTIRDGGFSGMTATNAVVYKVPPGSMKDFCLQTRRCYHATRDDRPAVRGLGEWRAFGAEAVRDPVGAVLYCAYRSYAVMSARRWEAATHSETWETSLSTKRGAPS